MWKLILLSMLLQSDPSSRIDIINTQETSENEKVRIIVSFEDSRILYTDKPETFVSNVVIDYVTRFIDTPAGAIAYPEPIYATQTVYKSERKPDVFFDQKTGEYYKLESKIENKDQEQDEGDRK